MLRIPKMPNPVSLAVDNYKMTNLGKAVVGSMIAQAATSMMESSYRQASPQSQPSYEELGRSEAMDLILQIANKINGTPEAHKVWITKSFQERRDWFVETFHKCDKSYLIPFLMEFLDKHFPV
jgi:hypothetical protein